MSQSFSLKSIVERKSQVFFLPVQLMLLLWPHSEFLSQTQLTSLSMSISLLLMSLLLMSQSLMLLLSLMSLSLIASLLLLKSLSLMLSLLLMSLSLMPSMLLMSLSLKLSLSLFLSSPADVVAVAALSLPLADKVDVVVDRLAAVDVLPLPNVLPRVPHHNTVLCCVCGRLITDPTRIVAVRAAVTPHPGALRCTVSEANESFPTVG